jgi:HECT-domain (ubiquitin-transferase)
MTREYFNLMSL